MGLFRTDLLSTPDADKALLREGGQEGTTFDPFAGGQQG
jgi:hypothetical protein